MEQIDYPDQNILRKQYNELYSSRELIADKLANKVSSVVRHLHSPPTVKARVKEFRSFFKKYVRFLKRGDSSPSSHITDIIGIRIVCPFMDDLPDVVKLIKTNFEIIEEEHKGRDLTFREFGYESIHLLMKIPLEIIETAPSAACEIAEIQVRTILQDAWAEVEHELFYKADFNPFDTPMKRKLHAVNASLILADIIFQEIRHYQRKFNGELDKRRGSFFKKIEDSTDALLFDEEKPEKLDEAPRIPFHDKPPGPPIDSYPFWADESIDDLLLKALSAHNKSEFPEAITYYTQILEHANADDNTKSLIYKHRGMAFFARSHYKEAIVDFSKALDLDPASYKVAYYKGVVYAVLKRYQDAIDAYDKALNINPYQPYCLYRRSQAYFHLEDYPQALADCEASLALDSSFEGAKKFKQLLLDKLKM